MKARRASLAALVLALCAATPAQAAEGNEALAAKGAALYRANCEACHGRGAAEPAAGVKDLRAFTGDEKAFATIVNNGRNAMPAHPHLSEADLAAIYAYVKSI